MRCSSDTYSINTVHGTNLATKDTIIPCSGRGDCLNGTCLCEIRYSGDECDNFNIPYHAGTTETNFSPHMTLIKLPFHCFSGVSSVFYFVAALSISQLLICCVAEYQRLKQPSFLGALRLTTQKLLYFVVFIAALLRGAYFTTPVRICQMLKLQ